jgi:predicted DNA-binding transcriptional regulator AlpA
MECLIEPLLEATRVARLLGVEVETLGIWRKRGYGPRWYRIGKSIRYAEAELRAWMSAQICSGVVVNQRLKESPAIQPEPDDIRPQECEGGVER